MYPSGILGIKLCLLFLYSFFCLNGLFAQGSAPLKVEANVSESHCAGTGHVISVKAKGGEAPFTYRWNDGVHGHFRKDLKPGTYTCTVSDSKGAVQNKTFKFDAQAAAISLNYKEESTAVGTFKVVLEAKGGKAPYTYVWLGPGIDIKTAKNKDTLDGLKKGVYQVVVQDVYGCSANVTINLN